MTTLKYQICSKTVMDNTDPKISFDSCGISNYYWDYHNNIKHKWQRTQDGSDKLYQIVETIKAAGKGKDFDCIIGLSGGLDSSYLLHKMVTKFDIRPLVFHVDGGWNTEAAVHNIHSLVNGLNIDLFTEVINWEEMRNFQLAMFKSGVPHIDIPQDMAFIGVLYEFARKNNIKYILNGGNISTESVALPVELLYWGTDMSQISDILGRFGTLPMNSYPFSSVFYHKIFLKYVRGVSVVKPLNFINYIKSNAINELVDIYGWKQFRQKHFESRFTRFFEGYWLVGRFGYDVRRAQLTSLILTEQMTRDQALEILQAPPLESSFIEQEIEFISTKLGITKSELDFYYKMEKRSYKDYKNQKFIFDFGEKVLSFLEGTRRGGAF